MSNTKNPILSKDGVSQDRRMLPMLDPHYALVDERSTADFLRFAHDLAQQIRFFDADGLPAGTWEGFLTENIFALSNLNPSQRLHERDKWIRQIVRYMEAPEKYEGPQERLERLSQPHLALFLTFLKLLQHIQTQLNGIGARHLDHYYRKALSLTRREALPDLVHAVVALTDGVNAHPLPKGTLFSAGTDSEGKELNYRLDEDSLITRASVSELRTVFVEKQHTTIRDYHFFHRGSPTQGFEEMWSMPLGEFGPGTKLPLFLWPTGSLVTFDEALFEAFVEVQDTAVNATGLSCDDFTWMYALAQSSLPFGTPPKNQDWNRILKLLPLTDTDTVTWLGNPLSRATFPADFMDTAAEKGVISNYEDLRAIAKYTHLRHAELDTIATQRRKERQAFENEDPLPQWTGLYPLFETAYQRRTVADRQKTLLTYLQDVDSKTNTHGLFETLAYATGRLKEPDGYLLPPYGNALSSEIPDLLGTHLLSSNTEEQNQAYQYVIESLHLEPRDFLRMLEIAHSPRPGGYVWPWVCEKLEVAQRIRDGIVLTAPVMVEWKNLYAFPDATLNLSKPDVGIEENDPRWKTFGQPQRNPNEAALRAELGFAICSELLFLSEGERRISLTLSCEGNSFPKALLETFLEEQTPEQPFLKFYLSSEKTWIEPQLVNISLGAFLPDLAGLPAEELFTFNGNTLRLTGLTHQFTEADRGSLIATPSTEGGKVYEIDGLLPNNQVSLRDTGTVLSNPRGLLRVLPEELLTHALRIELSLGVQDPAIGLPGETLEGAAMAQGLPMLRILLADIPYQVLGGNELRLRKSYQAFQALRVRRLYLRTTVSGLQSLPLQNELETIAPEKPFTPFTAEPKIDSAFYFTHTELVRKRLDTMNLHFQWDNPPADLVAHYSGYDKIETANPELPSTQYQIQSNTDFKAYLSLMDRRVKVGLGEYPLFDPLNAQTPAKMEIPDVVAQLHKSRPTYKYGGLPLDEELDDEALMWPRYFLLELGDQDFRHNDYTELQIRQAFISDFDKDLENDPENERAKALAQITLRPPLEPTLRNFRIDYSASETLDLQQGAASRIYHLHPFGYTQPHANSSSLFPLYDDEGHLYIALSDAEPGTVVPVLFQMAEGSANPDLPKATVTWSYLQGDNWLPFGEADIVQDNTGGLLKSGIIKLKVPEFADHTHQILPSERIWLRASVTTHTDSVSDVIRIVAQAVQATFLDQDNAETHLDAPLAPNTIAATVEPIVEVAEISQPFPSTGGRPRETDKAFFTRIAERLRHKRRAVTMWDYERLVLERFPDVHKVKCLSANYENPNETPGLVTMVVIPDIIGRFPFNPYQPKMPAEKLVEIKEYMAQFMSPFATLQVKNPRYLQVNVRVAVKLHAGYSEGFYKSQLEDDLRRYLAPWAYKEGRDIVFGGKLYANVIVDFIERRPYIDYIGRINLYQSDDGKNFRDARLYNQGENMVRADAPDIVLVSAVHHQVELIREGEFQEELPAGIGNAHIEVDFYVSENPIIES